jgi:hypothetical protein
MFSCKQENPEEIISHISGYWEIEEVTSAEGERKEFTINMLVDYIEINDKEGFRKKVAPQLDGTFNITDDAEKIKVKTENNQVQLQYSTPFDEWTETVVKADKNQLVLKNETGTVYTYKRFENLNLTQ